MGPFCIIGDKISVENDLHLVDGFEPCLATFDTEVLVEKRAMQALDNTVGLGPFDPGGAVLNVFELQEQFVRVMVGAPAELTAIAPTEEAGLVR